MTTRRMRPVTDEDVADERLTQAVQARARQVGEAYAAQLEREDAERAAKAKALEFWLAVGTVVLSFAVAVWIAWRGGK